MEATVIILWWVVSLRQNQVYVDVLSTVNLNCNGKILIHLLSSHTTFRRKILTDIPGKHENWSNMLNSVQTDKTGKWFYLGAWYFLKRLLSISYFFHLGFSLQIFLKWGNFIGSRLTFNGFLVIYLNWFPIDLNISMKSPRLGWLVVFRLLCHQMVGDTGRKTLEGPQGRDVNNRASSNVWGTGMPFYFIILRALLQERSLWILRTLRRIPKSVNLPL